MTTISDAAQRAVLLGCGDLGTRVGHQLADAGYQVTGVRRRVAALPAPITGLAADLSSGDVTGLRSLGPDLLVVALTAGQRDRAGYHRTYVEGMRRGIEALLHSGQPERAVLVSSTSVYGALAGDLDEDTAIAPARPTAEVLAEAEALFQTLLPDGVVLRLSGLYGGTSQRLIDQVRSGANPDPGRWTNRIHRDDAASAITHLLMHVPGPRPLYLGTDDEPCPAGTVKDFIADELGVPHPTPTGITATTGRRLSNARLRSTGWVPRYPTYREGYCALLRSLDRGTDIPI